MIQMKSVNGPALPAVNPPTPQKASPEASLADKVALNPQPLPPRIGSHAAASQAAGPGADRAIIIVGGKNASPAKDQGALNPQPLPPRKVLEKVKQAFDAAVNRGIIIIGGKGR
jgi:hypothetical protein